MIDTIINKSNPTNFRLVFPKIPTETDTKSMAELTLNIYGTIIPSLSQETTDQPFLAGKTIVHTGKITFEPWTVNFVVDEEFKNWKTLYKWVVFLNNNRDVMARLPKEYIVDATLQITDNFNKEILRIFFTHVWIYQLGEISLSYREGSSNLECSATFAYDRYELQQS